MSRRDGDLWTLPQGPSSSHQLQFLQAQKMACPRAKDFRAQELKWPMVGIFVEKVQIPCSFGLKIKAIMFFWVILRTSPFLSYSRDQGFTRQLGVGSKDVWRCRGNPEIPWFISMFPKLEVLSGYVPHVQTPKIIFCWFLIKYIYHNVMYVYTYIYIYRQIPTYYMHIYRCPI